MMRVRKLWLNEPASRSNSISDERASSPTLLGAASQKTRNLVDPALRVTHGKPERDLVAGSQVCQFFWLLHSERHCHGVHIVGDRLVAEQDGPAIGLEFPDHPSRREASQIGFARLRRRERFGNR